jgi:hypothetical protein
MRLRAEQVAIDCEALLDRRGRNADVVLSSELHSYHHHAELVSASILDTLAALPENGS